MTPCEIVIVRKGRDLGNPRHRRIAPARSGRSESRQASLEELSEQVGEPAGDCERELYAHTPAVRPQARVPGDAAPGPGAAIQEERVHEREANEVAHRLTRSGAGLPVHDAGDLRTGQEHIPEPHVSVDGGTRSLIPTEPVVDLRQQVQVCVETYVVGKAFVQASCNAPVHVHASRPSGCAALELAEPGFDRVEVRGHELLRRRMPPADVQAGHRDSGHGSHDDRAPPLELDRIDNSGSHVYDVARRDLADRQQRALFGLDRPLRGIRRRDFDGQDGPAAHRGNEQHGECRVWVLRDADDERLQPRTTGELAERLEVVRLSGGLRRRGGQDRRRQSRLPTTTLPGATARMSRQGLTARSRATAASITGATRPRGGATSIVLTKTRTVAGASSTRYAGAEAVGNARYSFSTSIPVSAANDLHRPIAPGATADRTTGVPAGRSPTSLTASR